MQRNGFVFRFSWGIAGLAAFGLALPVCIVRSVKRTRSEFARVAMVTRPVDDTSTPDWQTSSAPGQDERPSRSEGDRESPANPQGHVRSSDQLAGDIVAQGPISSLRTTDSAPPVSNHLRRTEARFQTNGAVIPSGFLPGSDADPGQPAQGNTATIIRMQNEEPETAEETGGAVTPSGPSLLTIGAGVLAAAGVTAVTLAVIEANEDPASP